MSGAGHVLTAPAKMKVVRILGVATDQLAGWRDPHSHNRWAGLFRGLDEHAEVIDVLRVPRPPGQLAARVVQELSGGRVTVNAGWRPGRFLSRSALLEPRLRARDGSYDVLLQIHTVHAPGLRTRPYAIYTDSTNALLERHDPTARDFAPQNSRRWQALEARVARRAQVAFTSSEFARRSLVEDYGCAPERVVAVGAGANVFVPTIPDRSTWRPRAVFVGYDFRRKGGLALLEAWTEVARRVPAAELVIAGPRAPVSSRAPGVRWVGRASEAQVLDLYRQATVFVLPSLYEPLGLVVLEAMGCGLPVVASRCCAFPEMVADGRTGLLTPPGDAAALAGALVALLEDPGRAHTMGRAGHEKVMAAHAWGQVGARMIATLRRWGAPGGDDAGAAAQ